MIRRPPKSTLFPYTTLSQSSPAASPAASPATSPTKPVAANSPAANAPNAARSEEHTSELQSRQYLVCRLLLEKKKTPEEDALTSKGFPPFSSRRKTIYTKAP